MECNIDMHSCNHCLTGRPKSITYCHLWPAPLCSIFPHYLINSKILKKNYCPQNVFFFISSTAFVWNISHSKKRGERYDHNCPLVFMQSTRYSCPILMKLEFCRHFPEIYSSIKFYENPSNGSMLFLRNGWTWRSY